MTIMVHLAIKNAATFEIAVVRAPFALMRGGASPAALLSFKEYQNRKFFSIGELVPFDKQRTLAVLLGN